MVVQQRIGDIMVAQRVINRETADALDRQRTTSQMRFASLAVQQGHVSVNDALSALSSRWGCPNVDLGTAVIPRAILDLIPARIAAEQLILPFRVDGRNLMLAVADPSNQKVLEEVAFATGLVVRVHVALHTQLSQTVEDAYRAHAGAYFGTAIPQEQRVDNDEPPPIITSGPSGDDTEPELHIHAPDIPPESPAASEVTGPETTTDRRARILVVEDDPQIQHLIARTLEASGHEVITASRGLEALKLIKSVRPQLIVLDAMLPEVHGFEICRKVKESKRFGDTPVLMISAIYRGWRIAEDIKATYQVDDFLEKPFRVGELRARAQKLLEAHAPFRGEDELSEATKTYFDAAVSAFKDDEYASAFEQLRRAEELEPFSARIQFALGQVLEKDDRTFQAMYHYERAIELSPNLYAAAHNLAMLYQTKGFKRKAIEMWERALMSAPSNDVRATIKQHLVNIL